MREYKGIPACPGSSTGEARIVEGLDPSIESFPSGSILIVEFSTPMLFPFFLKASAVVSERGGTTCHAATLARELGLPCVTGVAGVTNSVRDGQMVSVNGATGTVLVDGD